MQSRSILNIVLFIVVLALTLNLYLVKNSKNASNTVLTNIRPDTINHISIRHNKRIINLAKDTENWRMIEPISINANNFRITSILKLLTTSSHGKYPVDEIDLSKYGLDKPSTLINFNDLEIAFGTTNPVSNLRYIKTGKKMYLIDDNFYPLLSSQIGTLIARTLLPDNAEIIKLVLPEHIFELDDNDLWVSTPGVPADNIIETTINWKKSQAFNVHNYIKRKSLGNVKVYLKNSEAPITFKITDTDPWLVIARPELGIEYHFNHDFYSKLIKPDLTATSTSKENDQLEPLIVQPEEFLNTINQ